MCVFFVLEQQGKEMMAGGVCERVAAISLIAVLLQLAGLTLFVLGFFPVKPALMGIRMQGFLFVSFTLPFMVLRWCGDGVIHGGEIKMAFVQFFFPLFQELHCTVENCSGIESVKPVCNYEEEATHKGASYQEVSGITPQYDRLIIMVSFLCLTFHL
jgi:hypothetical protein